MRAAIKKKDRNWQRHNAERVREAVARRAALKGAATVEPVSYAAILARDGYVCHLCGTDVAPGDVNFDHVIPLSRGGAHSEENIKVAHSLCNRRKGAKTVAEFRVSTDNRDVVHLGNDLH